MVQSIAVKYNDVQTLLDWVDQTLESAVITPDERVKLRVAAVKVIATGGLRGDVSQVWVSMGYGHSKIKDLYL